MKSVGRAMNRGRDWEELGAMRSESEINAGEEEEEEKMREE